MLQRQAGARGLALAGAAKPPKLPQKPQGWAEEEEESRALLSLLQAGWSRFGRGQQAAALIEALSEATEGRPNHPLGWCMYSASNFASMTPNLRYIETTALWSLPVGHCEIACCCVSALSCRVPMQLIWDHDSFHT